ncbi:MAG: TonB-dependent receptor [Bryobacteraceae bacterium]|nr:TonB-dependent receptor [Bryobacteraceae bacterium]
MIPAVPVIAILLSFAGNASGPDGPSLVVVDPSGALIPNAVIERNGPVARISAPGFAGKTVVLPGSSEEVRVVLEPAPLRTTVDVVVRAAGAETAQSISTSALEMEATGARTVLDAVDRVAPSAFVTRRSIMGYGIATNGTGAVSVRGIGGSPNTGVLVVVDGRPDFQALMGHPLPDLYTLSDAASVRVTLGPASVLYGSNAMGGAIEVIPARPEAGFQTRLTTSLGSWWTTQNRLNHAAKFSRGFYSLNAGYSGTSGERPSSDFRNPDGTFTFGADLSEHWKASVESRYGFFHVEDPGPVSAPLQGSWARVGRGGYSLNLNNDYGRTYGYLRQYGAWGRHFITDGFRSTDSTKGLRAMQTILLRPELTLDVGGDFNHYGGAARNVRSRLDYGRHALEEGAGFARLHWQAAPRLLLNGGYRHHRHSVYGGLNVPEASATVRLHPLVSWSAGVSRGFRNPTIRELYLFPAPNPNLRPERLWHWHSTLYVQPHRTLSAWATGYYSSLTDQIVTLGRFPNLRLENTGRAILRGADLNAQWAPSRAWRISGGAGLLRSAQIAPLLPKNKFNGAVQYQNRRFSASLSAMLVGRRFTNTARTATMGGYPLVTLQGSWRAARGVTFFVLADNVLNRRYEVLPGYIMPRANAAAGLTLQF